MKKPIPIFVLLVLCACAQPPAAEEQAAGPVHASAAAVPPPERLDRERIYYDLTRFDWYARGQPLLDGGASYQPAGVPVAAPLSELARAGEYEGVEYYRRTGDGERLYVPVFDGYWLPFEAAVADPAD